tara:strand:+ start:1810 stop:2223 length:414 start_codon:yes stop_codon:yes gene_type:complete
MPDTNTIIYTGTWTAALNTYGHTATFNIVTAEGHTTSFPSATSDVYGDYIQGVSITNNTDEVYQVDVRDTASTTHYRFVDGLRLFPRTTTQLFTAKDRLQLNTQNMAFVLDGPTGQQPSTTNRSGQVCVAVTYTIRR